MPKEKSIIYNNSEKKQRKMLKKAKVTKLSIFEAIKMNIIGQNDGKIGLPRQTETGTWDSPILRKEANAYNESCELEWGGTQMELKHDYAAVGALIDKIKRKEQILVQLRLEPPIENDELFLCERRCGEENLTDSQVKKRRQGEIIKKNAPYYEKIRIAEEEIRQAYIEIDEKLNHIIEINNGTRMICERLKYHAEQRRDIYWNAAYRKHPSKNEMPVVVEALPKPEAELTYIAQHKALEDEALAMLSRYGRLLSRYSEDMASESAKKINKEIA